MKKFFVVLPILFLLLILIANLAYSQNQTKDVVCFKKRSVIKGDVIEQIPGLLNDRSGIIMSTALIPMGKALQAKGITCRGRSNEITSAELEQILKKPGRTITGSAQVYLIDTVIVHSTADTERYSYSYNAGGIVNSSLKKLWQNGQWMNSEFDTTTYDAGGNELTDMYEEWQNGQWTNSEFYTMTYDASGHELTFLEQKWQNGQWTNNILYTITYDTSGNELTELYEDWQNGQWTNYGLYTWTYDASGNELTELYEKWQNSQWTNYVLSTYTYDASGNKLTFFEELWQNDQWTNAVFDTFTYDTSGHELTGLGEVWQNVQWTNSWRDTMTYDASGNRLTYLSVGWQGGQWTNQWLETYTYDANENLVAFSSASWQDPAWVPSNGGVYVADGPNYDEYYEGYDIRIAYKLTNVTGISASKPNVPAGFSLSQNYPNPFNPSTTISFSLPSKSYVTLKVFDILGREVASIVSEEMPAGSYSRQWNAANISSGIYYYRLQAGRFVETKKLVSLR